MSPTRRPAIPLAARQAIMIVAVLVLWQALAGGLGTSPIVDPVIVSQPTLIAADLARGLSTAELWSDIAMTLQEAFAGLVLGIVTGAAVGLAFGTMKPLAELLDPLLTAMNSIPRPALAPLFALWLGLGAASKILVAWSLVFFVIFYNTMAGLRGIEPVIVQAIQVMGATRLQVLRIVVLPSVVSWIVAGLHSAVAFALIGAVIGEFVGSTKGLGHQMMLAEGIMQTERLYSIIVILCAVAMGLNGVTRRVERRLLRWRPNVSL